MQAAAQACSVLQQISRRYCSIFFSKLVLLSEHEEYSDDGASIRHYDIQCEAVSAIQAIITTKIKAIQFKTFFQIKNHKPRTIRKPKKTFIPNFSTASISYTPKIVRKGKEQTSNLSMNYFSRTPRNPLGAKNYFGKTVKEDRSQKCLFNNSLNLSSRVFNRTNTQSRFSSEQMISRKLLKKQTILAKIEKLEADLQELMNESDEQNYPQSSTSIQVESESRRVVEGQKEAQTRETINLK